MVFEFSFLSRRSSRRTRRPHSIFTSESPPLSPCRKRNTTITMTMSLTRQQSCQLYQRQTTLQTTTRLQQKRSRMWEQQRYLKWCVLFLFSDSHALSETRLMKDWMGCSFDSLSLNSLTTREAWWVQT